MGLQFRFFILLITVINFSCKNFEKENGNTAVANIESTDSLKIIVSDSLQSEKNISLSTTNKYEPEIGLPPVDGSKSSSTKSENKESDIQIKTFRNEDLNGYGYDIILNGHVYVHQPNIPAVPGNNGFVSEKQAQKVAELVAFKIRNNIMPPTLSVEELDSLGVK